MQILVVDDDEVICTLLAARLRAWGHNIETTQDGAEAWKLLSDKPFDLVISDWNMPVMDGLELCRKIRESHAVNYVYVILCTAMNQKSDYLAGMEAGADDFVVKPVDFTDLRVRIRAAERLIDLQTELATQNKNLREIYSKLSHAYSTIERDLQAASAMQLRLLPKKAEISPHVGFDWLLVPSQFLAGDMLNCFMADEHTLVFYQLDVAGHGIPAALQSVTLNRLLIPVPGSPLLGNRASPAELAPPAEVVAELNRRFQGDDDSYFTILYGTIDTRNLRLCFCQAGHPGPILLPYSGKPTLLGHGGFPVGMVLEMDYEEELVQLHAGDRIVLHSDGITECQNPQGARYSDERLFKVLEDHKDQPLKTIVESVQRDVSAWRGQAEFADDISLLILECT